MNDIEKININLNNVEKLIEKNQTPNLFEYATSELSQDAFICWLVSWANEEYEDYELYTVAKELICLMFNMERETDKLIEPNQVKLLCKPLQQYKKIDVLIIAKILDENVAFIIEDKTETGHHDNQLVRYKDEIRGYIRINKETEYYIDKVVGIYYKTGYLYDDDIMAKQYGYNVINIDTLLNILNKHVSRNNVYQDYKVFINKIYYERETDINNYKNTEKGQALLTKDYVQWDFMRILAESCLEKIGHRALYRGKNPDGRAWTHYRFARFENIYGDKCEDLFYRMDGRLNDETHRWEIYLSIRQYAKINKLNDTLRSKKLNRLNKFKNIFNTMKSKSESKLKFSNVSVDNARAYESEIAILFFDNTKENKVDQVLKEIPNIHKEFVDKINENISND